MISFDLRGRTAIVTGGFSGLGIDRPDDIRAYETDVTDSASVSNTFSQVMADLGMPAIVVNNAGTAVRGASIDVTDADWSGVVEMA